MTATFNPNLADNISKVRQLLGDTDPLKAKIQDETINHYLQAQLLTVKGAAAALAWGMVAQFASYADVTVDDQLTRMSHIYKNWLSLAERLQAEADAETVAPTPTTAGQGLGAVIVTGLGDFRGPLDGLWN